MCAAKTNPNPQWLRRRVFSLLAGGGVPPSTAIARGDATRASDVAGVLRGRRVQLLLTDPPFCLLERRRSGGEVRVRPVASRARKLDAPIVVRYPDVAAYAAFTRAWLSVSAEHLSATARVIIYSNALGRGTVIAAAEGVGLHYWGRIPWAKASRALPAASTANEETLRVYEWACVFGRSAPPPPLRPDEPASLLTSGIALVSGYHDTDAGAPHAHPHHKPRGALDPLIRAFSRPGELVFDPFAGDRKSVV